MLVAQLGPVAAISFLLGACVEAAGDDLIAAPDLISGCTPTTRAADARLTGVWIAPGGDPWAVGDAGATPAPAVHHAADDDLWITGAAGTVLRWRGTSFDPIDVGATADVAADQLGAVWGASAHDAWIGGHRRTTTTTPSGAERHGCEATIYAWSPLTSSTPSAPSSRPAPRPRSRSPRIATRRSGRAPPRPMKRSPSIARTPTSPRGSPARRTARG